MKIKKNLTESYLAFLIIGIIIIIVIPMPPVLLDILFIINIAFSLTILLTSIYVKEPLDFSVFPTILLVATLFRLSLNISSTRLILSNNGDAGKVIETFGRFVVRGNVIVGLIIFLIIVVIQFIVITKGSERVSEVAARFTLDSMPGKQMAIDADLNSGLINEKEAKARRKKVGNEANFYGSMDGASKFVKGDAIAGIIITLINLVGGIVIGTVAGNMEFRNVLDIYSLAAVGDGLVSQIPALLISTATGIITTRAVSDNSLNKDVSSQLFSQANVLFVGGTTLILLNFVPGFPKFAMITIGGLMLFLGYRLYRKKEIRESDEKQQMENVQDEPTQVNLMDLLHVDPITLQFGYSLVPLIDEEQGGDLIERMSLIRQQCATEIGIIIPVVRFRDNLALKSNEYVIMIKGAVVAKGEVLADHLLAMNTQEDPGEDIDGIDTLEPAFGMPAKWIRSEDKDKAEMLGYTVIFPSSVIATHLTAVIKKHSHELVGRQEVKTLLDNIKEQYPALVEEVVPGAVSVGTVQKVLTGLLKEGLSIRNLPTILEVLGDYGKVTKDANLLVEYARQSLKREITGKFASGNRIDVITLDGELENMISQSVRQSDGGSYLALDPSDIKGILENVDIELKKASEKGIEPVILTSPNIRSFLKELSRQINPGINILSYNELENSVNIQVVGNIAV